MTFNLTENGRFSLPVGVRLGYSTTGIAAVKFNRRARRLKMYRRILVTLDGSELAEQVLPHVKSLIEDRHGIHLYLLSVAQVIDLAAASAMVYPIAVYPGQPFDEQAERRRVEDELCSYLRGLEVQLKQNGIEVSTEVLFGQPADEIIAYAHSIQADLIAMCTHGRSGLARWAYGSVADRVLHAAECPVLLVRAQQD
jgi:nucleotide-binding universal stress UspA family protein